MDEVQWDLQPCCERDEKVFLALFFSYLFLIHFLWRYELLKPMKLLGVFVHEMGHASAAWLTCGKVKKIEVYQNEGGIAGYSGGIKVIVIPGGYVGGAFWGAAFVTLSGNRVGATVAACLISAALIVSLAHNPNKIVVYLSIGFSIVTILAIIIDWFIITPFLQYITLFYGVFFGYYACRDIWDDTVARDSDGSDAQACHKVLPFCLPRWVGVQFLILALVFQVLGIYFALVWLVTTTSYSD